jgi:putative flippase GtrA
LRYLAANAIGGLANYATYALLVATVEPVRRWPVLAVAAGSVAGLLLNFFLSRRFVFGRD